jgi:hypothetical protein
MKKYVIAVMEINSVIKIFSEPTENKKLLEDWLIEAHKEFLFVAKF